MTERQRSRRRHKADAPSVAGANIPYQATDRERLALERLAERRASTPPAPRLTVERQGQNRMLNAEHPDGAVHTRLVCAALGANSPDAADMMLAGLAMTTARDRRTGDIDARVVNGALATVSGIAPRDEVEGMLAVQMVTTHNLALEMMRRANIEQPSVDVTDRLVNRAVKLLRTYTAQVETLHRYRNGGTQKVVVQHQHVGITADKAVVGINAPAMVGGGHEPEREHQPHARRIAHAPEPSLSCPDTTRDCLPVTGDGERSL